MAEFEQDQLNTPVSGISGETASNPDKGPTAVPLHDASMENVDIEALENNYFTFPIGTLSPANDMVNNWQATAQIINQIPTSYAPGINQELLPPLPEQQQQTKVANIAEQHRRSFKNMLTSSQNHAPAYVGADPKPIHFSTKGFNFDKWQGSADFQEIGFHPFRDNEALYKVSEDFWDRNSRMSDNYGKLFWPAFTSGWRALGDMISGERTYLQGDYLGAISFHDAMRKGGGDWVNNTLLQTGFTMGIITSIALEELVLAGVTSLSGGNPVVGGAAVVRTGKNVKRAFDIPKYFSRVYNNFGLTRAVSGGGALIRSLRKAENAKDYWRAGLRFGAHMIAPETAAAWRTLNTTKNVANGIQGFGKGAQYFGAFYRDLRAVNLAVAESKLEGGMVFNEMVDHLYLEERAKLNGGDPSMEALENVYKHSKEAEFQTVIYNAPVIFLTNKLVIGTALKGFKGLAGAMASAAGGMGRRVLTFAGVKTGKEAIKKGSKWWLPRVMARGFKGNMQQIMGAGLLYGRANLAEGFQELYQEGLAVAMKDYYTNLHNDNVVVGWDAQKASSEWSDSKGRGVSAMMTKQGAEIFASGFVMGGLVQMPQHIMFKTIPSTFHRVTNNAEWTAQQEQQEANLDIAVEHLQEMYDDAASGVGRYFDISKLNSTTQKHLSEIMFEADQRYSALEYHDAKDASIYSHLNSLHMTGKSHFFKSQFQDFLELDDKALAEAFPEESNQDGVDKVRSRIVASVERIDTTEKAWKELNQELTNPFDRNKYKPGTDEYTYEYINEVMYNQFKNMMMFNTQMMKRAVERYNSIYGDLTKSGVSKNIQSKDIDVLTNVSALVKEMSMLEVEMELSRTTEDLEIEMISKSEYKRLYQDIAARRQAELDKLKAAGKNNAVNVMKVQEKYDAEEAALNEREIFETEEKTEEKPRYQDKQVPAKREEFTVYNEDGTVHGVFRATTHLDGSVEWKMKAGDMWTAATVIDAKVQQRENISNEDAIKAYAEVTVRDAKTDEVKPSGMTYKVGKVESYDTVMNSKMWDRLTADQKSRVDSERAAEESSETETTETKIRIKSGEELTEDEAMLQMAEDERKQYLDKQERLVLLKKIFEVLTDKENVIKTTDSKEVLRLIKAKVNKDDSLDEEQKKQEIARRIFEYEIKSVEKNFGFFDRRKVGKLAPVVQAYIEYLSKQEGGDGIVDMTKFEDFMKGIMDYKALNGRSIELNKAINMMINPDHALEMQDRMALGMLKAYRENREKIEGRLRGWIGTQSVNVFLNDLANAGIYPIDEEMEAFLKDPQNSIPRTYRTENGMLTKETDALKYSQLNTIRINFKESMDSLFKKEEKKEEKKAEKETIKKEVKSFQDFVEEEQVDDPVKKQEEKLDQRIKDAEEMEEGIDDNRLRIPSFIKAVLDRRHATYVENWKLSDTSEDYMEMEQWREQPKIKSIYKALTEIYKIYALERSTEDFGEWLEKNRTTPQIRKIYHSQFALTYTDIAVKEPKGFQKSTLDKGARETVLLGKGVNIIRKTVVDDDGNERYMYDITDDYKNSLILKPIEGEDALNEAKKKQQALINKSTEGGSFEFEGKAFKHGEVIEDKEGNSWVVISKRDTFNGNDLYITPIQDFKKKIKRKKVIKTGKFTSEEWTRSSDQSIDKKAKEKVSQLRPEEALYISSTRKKKKDTNGYYKGDDNLEDTETKQEADERQQTMLRNLEPAELAGLTLRISYGPKWAHAEGVSVDKKTVADNHGKEYAENKNILKHAQEYSVEVLNGETSLGYLNGPTSLILLDSMGTAIHPEVITESQVLKLFRTYGNQNITKVTKDVRNHYIQAYYLYEQFNNALKGKGEDAAVDLKLSDLDYVDIKISRGNEAFVEKGTKGVKFEDLEYKYIDGESIYWILQYRRDYSITSGGKIKTLDRSITNVKRSQRKQYEDIVDELVRARGNQLAKLGAYVAVVQLPNGSYSLIEVKAPTMSDEKANNIISSIHKQVEKTLDNNVTKTKDDKVKPKSTSFNHEFNDKLGEDLFIANDVGTDVQLNVTPYGELEITLYNKKAFEKKDGKAAIFERKKLVKGEELENIKTARDLINYINKLSIDAKNFAKTQNDTALIKQADKIKLNLTVNAFKESIPDKGISSRQILKQHLLPAETSYEARVRKNIKLLMSASDSAGMDSTADRLKTIRRLANEGNAKTIIEEETPTEIVETEELTPEIISNAYENPEAIPSAVIAGIVGKLIAGEGLNTSEINLYENIAKERIDEAYARAEAQETEDSSTKEEYRKKVNIAKQKAEDYYNIKTNEIIEELVKQGQTSAQAKGAAYLTVMNDPVYLSLIEEYEDLNSNSALAVIPGVWDGYDIEKIDDFIAWAKEALPEQLYTRVDHLRLIDELGIKLKEAKYKVGRFLMHGETISELQGEISVGKYTPLKYHEAFHGVFRMLLTDQEIKHYLGLAKKEVRAKMRDGGIKLTHGVVVKNVNDALKEMRKVHPKYAEMTRAKLEETLYEEYLANQFDNWKMNPQSVSTETRSLFQKIMDFIKHLLGYTREKSINDLFNEIDSGVFRTKATKNNMFTRAAESSSGNTYRNKPVAFAIVNIPTGVITTSSVDTRTREERTMDVTSYLPADDAQKMIFTIGQLFMNRREKSSIADSALLDNTISDFVNMYNVTDRIEFYQEMEGFIQFAPKLKKHHDALSKHESLIKDAVLNYIGAFAVKENENDIEESEESQEYGLRSTSQYSKDQSMIGGWSKLSQWVRQYIGLTTLTEVDEYGNEFINPEAPQHLRERVTVPVDFMFVYRGILKSVKNSRNDQELIKKMVMFSRSDNKHTRAFVDKFLTDIGLTESEVLSDDWQLGENVKDAIKFQRVVNAFRLYRTTNAIVHRDVKGGRESGIYYMYEANRQDDEHSQTKVWAAKFIQKAPRLLKDSELQREVIRALDDLIDLLEVTSITDRLTTEQLSKIKNYDVSKDDSLEGRANYISSILNEGLGMSLRSEYIKYSVTNNIAEEDRTNQQQALYTLNNYIEAVDTEAIREIKMSLQKGEHLYRDYQELFDEETGESLGFQKGGVKGRIRKLAANNAQFDESVGESTFMSADNHRIWSSQVPTFHLETIAEMRGNEWIKKIQDDDNFTYDSLIKDEKFLEAVRRGEIRHIRLSGHKLAPLGMDTGEFELGSGNGVSYGDLSMKDFIKNMLAMATYTYDKSSPLKKTPVFETKDGQKFVMAPVPIKILSDASTLDMIVMPVNHMIHQTDEGEIELTEEGVDLYMNNIQEEYARIQKENDLETKDERTIEGFNTGEMRGLQLFNTGNLMNVRDGNIKSTIRVQPPSLADVTIEGILEGNQKITLLSKAQSGKVRIAVGTTAVVELIKRDKAGGEYVAITNKGLSNVEDVDLARVIEDLGTMVYRTRPEARGKKEPLSFTYRKKKFWTFSWNLVNFVNGKQDFYILRYNTNIEGEAGIIDPTAEYNISERTVEELTELRDDAIEREEYELAQQLTNELNNRSKSTETKKGVDFIFKQTSELADIGTPEQYSAYINSLFPKSQEKDILWHMSKDMFDKYDPKLMKSGYKDLGTTLNLGRTRGHWLEHAYEVWIDQISRMKYEEMIKYDKILKEIEEHKVGSKEREDLLLKQINTLAFIINIKNPYKSKDFFSDSQDTGNAPAFKKKIQKEYDSIIDEAMGGQIAIFEDKNYLRLGSQEDIQGFKEFTSNFTSPKADKLYTLDVSVKEEMERRALAGDSWAIASKEPITYTDANGKKVTTTLEERVKQKQMQELGDFTNMLYEQNIMASLPLDVREGLIDVDTNGTNGVTYSTTQETDYLEKLYNIKHGNREYNLAQLFFNFSINARRFAKHTTGDSAMSFTDMFVNLTKRAKGEHGGGTNFATDIIAPELGIHHKNKDINLLTIRDPKFQKLYNDIFGTGDVGSPGKTADAFAVMTTKAALHTAFGDGRLSWNQAQLIKKISNGDKISSSEIFGDSQFQGGLILPIGIPGSGKSTWINKLRSEGRNVLVISPDAIRAELTDVSDQSNNALVFKLAHERAATGLRQGKLVVFDATNTMQEGPFGRTALIENLKKMSGKEFTTYYEMFDVDIATVKERIKKDIATGKKRANVPEHVIDRMHTQFVENKDNLSGMIKFDIAHVQNKGLKKLDAFLNSKKFMYYDGTTYLKMSVVALIPELTSVKIDGEWVARIGREEWHDLRLKLEAQEANTETFSMAAFESASKMAKINVVDTKDAFSKKDVSDMFTTIQAKYLRRQMINPSNKMEIVDAVQMKHKLPSEQIEGKTIKIDNKSYSIREVMDKYHETIQARLANKYFRRRNLIFTMESSLNELTKSKEIGEATVNLKAFVDYAQNALEASQAKVQMLDLFETENGTPKYNLNNPITEKQFEKLFLTFFSKGVLSERLPGTSLALMPEFGFKVVKKVVELDKETGQPIRWDIIRSEDWEINYRPKGIEIQHKEFADENAETFVNMKKGDIYLDVLRHDVMIYNEKGEPTDVTGSEFMMSPHFKSIMDHIKPGDKIPDVIAKAFGIRIPSQDDHSAVNLIMVDFLPAVYGSTAIFSKRLIEISGADFDIDKLYTQLKEFYHEKGVFKEYGKGENRKQQYADYIRNTITQYGNKKSDIFMATEVWADRGDFVSAITERTITSFNKENGTEYTVEEILESDKKVNAFIAREILEISDPLTDQQVLKLWKRNEDIQGGLWLIGLPSTLEEYNQYRDEYGREPYDAALNNDALDLKYALLGNPGKTQAGKGDHVAPAYQSAVVTPLEEAWDFFESQMPMLSEERKAQEYDPYNLLGQAVAFNSNKEFSRGIGSIVAPNLPLNVLSEHNAKLRNDEYIPVLELNGQPYKGFVKKYAINTETGEEDSKLYRKQFAISALISGIVDNANEQLAQKLGIVKESLPVLGTLVAMGVDMNTALVFINHPAINLIYEELGTKGKMEAGFDKRLLDRIIYIEKTVLKRKATDKETKALPEVSTEEMVKFINETKINRTVGSTKAGYVKEAKGSNFEVLTNDQALFDLAVLKEFQKAKAYTDFVRNVGVLLNIAKGTGQDTAAIEDAYDAAAELGLDLNNKEFSKTNIPFDVRSIFNDGKTFQSTYWQILQEINEKVLPKVLLNRTTPFLRLRDSLLNNLNQGRINSEQRRILSSEITSYLAGKAYIQWLKFDDTHVDQLASLSNGYIYDALGEEFTVISVVDRMRRYLTNKGRENYFLNEHIVAIDTKHEDNKQGFSRLITSNWTQFTDEELSNLQSSMLELYSDVNTRQDLMHLINYLTVKDGLRFNAESFINVVPASLLQNQLNVVTDVHKLFLDSKPSDKLYDRIFGATYKELQYELIVGFTEGVNSNKFITQINSKKLDQSFVVDAEEATIPESTMNINYYAEEGDSNTKLLSNLAERKFKYDFKGKIKEYSSVEQAFQSLRSGEFDQKTYDKYKKKDGYGIIIEGKETSESIDPLALMRELVITSFTQNHLNDKLIKMLMGHSNFTISQGLTVIDRAMLDGLRMAQTEFVTNKESQRYVTRGYVKDRAKHASKSVNNRTNERLDEGTLRVNALFDLGKNSMFANGKPLTGKKLSALNKTKEILEELGIGYTVSDKKGRPRITANFPYALTVIDEDLRGNKEYRHYKLEGMIQPGDGTINVDMFDVMNDNGEFLGVIAEYVKYDQLGSRQQKGPAYLYGQRPTYKQLRQNEEDKAEGWDDLVLGIGENIGDGFEEMFDFTKRGEDKAFSETDDVTATDKGYTAIEKEELLEDYDQKTGKTMGDVESTLETDDEGGFEIDNSRFVDLDAILNKTKDTSEQTDDSDQYPLITEYFTNLSGVDKLKLMDELNISTINELFTIFEDQNNLDNEKQFIDRLKSCY